MSPHPLQNSMRLVKSNVLFPLSTWREPVPKYLRCVIQARGSKKCVCDGILSYPCSDGQGLRREKEEPGIKYKPQDDISEPILLYHSNSIG